MLKSKNTFKTLENIHLGWAAGAGTGGQWCGLDDLSPPYGICRIEKGDEEWFTGGKRSVAEAAAGIDKDLCARWDIFCKAVMPAEDVDDEEVFDHESIIKDANDIRLGGPVLLLRSKGRVGCGVVSGSGLTFFSAISDCCCSRNANCACNCIHLAARLMVWSSSVLSSVQRTKLVRFVTLLKYVI